MFLNIKTEYTFRGCFAKIDKIADWLESQGATAACISDLHNTFGHIPWRKALESRGIKPVYGSTFSVVLSDERIKIQPARASVIALNSEGLQELYELVRISGEQFYYIPRLTYEQICNASANVAVVFTTGADWGEITKYDRQFHKLLAIDMSPKVPDGVLGIAGQNNFYVERGDKPIYEIVSGEMARGLQGHLVSKDEWLLDFSGHEAALGEAERLLATAGATMEHAPMVRFPTRRDGDLARLCKAGAERLGVDLSDPIYAARYERETDMINQKGFVDYFLIVHDLVAYAKRHMFVGPARGSSAGSLVCYLLGITTIDPIKFDLLFERFIDINRLDLPDIDIDFPDSHRQMVIDYLAEKYGQENVAHIGTVGTFNPKGAINLFAKALRIPAWEVKELKDAIIERSSGDARAAMCIEDTLTGTEAGEKFLKKYPHFIAVTNIEGHAFNAGTHAAGIVVCNQPITKYAGVGRENVAMVDKSEAEAQGMLKIDVLGLRTLSILQECCDDLGITYDDMYRLPLDDSLAFEIFNNMQLAGIFQFEGYALQSITKQMGVRSFSDIAVITALARPGPLHNGGTTEFIKRRTGQAPVTYYAENDVVKKYTQDELGTFVYQEQIMSIGREFGGLSWEDVSELRKAMSKSKGEEFFGRFRKQFIEGATKNGGITEAVADNVWQNMVTFGSWGFNKSHAVAYGLISYWCAYLKAHHPLEFVKATLNHPRSDEQSIKLLRETGVPYTAIDPEHSMECWVITGDRRLVGPLTNIKGIGAAKAAKLVEKRLSGAKYTEAESKLLYGNNQTPFDELYPARALFGHLYEKPIKLGAKFHDVCTIESIQGKGEYLFIGKLVDRNLRDHNEYGSVVKRGYEMHGPTQFLNLTVEDDTGSIICTVNRHRYEKKGKWIAETGQVGEDWFAIFGVVERDDWRRIEVLRIKRLNKIEDDKQE